MHIEPAFHRPEFAGYNIRALQGSMTIVAPFMRIPMNAGRSGIIRKHTAAWRPVILRVPSAVLALSVTMVL